MLASVFLWSNPAMLLHCVNQFALNTFRLQRAPTVPSFQKKQRRPKHDDNIKSYRISPKRLLAPSPSSSCTKLESKAITNCNNHAECQYFECIASVIFVRCCTANVQVSPATPSLTMLPTMPLTMPPIMPPTMPPPVPTGSVARNVCWGKWIYSTSNMEYHLPQHTISCINRHRTHCLEGMTSERTINRQ